MAGWSVTWRRWWRWLAAGAAVAVLLAVPTVLARVPAADSSIDAQTLRGRILASGGQPYSGYAESVGRLGVPALPRLDEVAALLSGTTRMRVWYAAADRWRVDELAPAGERGSYRSGGAEFVWDYGEDRLTRIQGAAPVRPPRPGDLLPPELARRLLTLAGDGPVTRLPARRVAGVDAAGLRLTSTDDATTVGAIEVWADPATGLALQVQLTARDADGPALISRLVEVSLAAPPEHVLQPSAGAGTTLATATAADVAGVLRGLGAAAPPGELAGRSRTSPAGDLPGVARYGTGLSGFVVVPVTSRLVSEVINGGREAGAAQLAVPSWATAVRLQTPLLTVVALRMRRQGYLLAGAVTPAVLEQAAVELAGGAAR